MMRFLVAPATLAALHFTASLTQAVEPHEVRAKSAETAASTLAPRRALRARLAKLEERLTRSEETIATLMSKTRYLTTDDGNTYFTGCNVAIRSGSEHTDGPVNGLGNLIIGYNEALVPGSIRTGSHNLVIGSEHSYASYGGLVAGFFNSLEAPNATVTAGAFNRVLATRAAIHGGEHNQARGLASSIGGGLDNTTGVPHAMVNGRRSFEAGRVPNPNDETGELIKNDAVGWCSDRNGAIVTSLRPCARNDDCGTGSLALCDRVPPTRLTLDRDSAARAEARAEREMARGSGHEQSGRYLSPFTTPDRAFNPGAMSPFGNE